MTDDSDARRQRSEAAKEVGCFGLVDGKALSLQSGRRYMAHECSKDDGPFVCPECWSDAVIRKCTEKRDHFAHHARQSPILPAGESDIHQKCKHDLCNLLADQFPGGNWAVERTLSPQPEKNRPELRPDISGRLDGQALAIEVQATPLPLTRLIERAKGYTQWGIPVLWLVPLAESLGDLPFRPRSYERFLHGMYYGRVYYWTWGQGLILKPVHFKRASRYIDYREWFSEDGEDCAAGGYCKPYKTISMPLYGPDLDITTDFERALRAAWVPRNEKRAIPECLIWRDRQEPWWSTAQEEPDEAVDVEPLDAG